MAHQRRERTWPNYLIEANQSNFFRLDGVLVLRWYAILTKKFFSLKWRTSAGKELGRSLRLGPHQDSNPGPPTIELGDLTTVP